MESSPLTLVLFNMTHLLFHLVLMHLLHIGLMLTQDQMMEEMYFIKKQPMQLSLIELHLKYRMLLGQHFLLLICSLQHGMLLDTIVNTPTRYYIVGRQ